MVLPLNSTSDDNVKTAHGQFYIGIFIAIASRTVTGTSYIFTKMGVLKLAKRGSLRVSDGGLGYLKEPFWWLGIILMGIGESGNLFALGFAPASVVIPLGAISVIVTAVLSSFFLHETLNILGKIGCLLCILGSTMIVLHSAKERTVETMAQMAHLSIQPAFLTYITLAIIIMGILAFFAGPRYGASNVLVFISVCCLAGSLAVAGAAGVATAVGVTVAGTSNEFRHWLTWLSISVLIIFVVVQIHFLAKALDAFNTAIITPIYYVGFTCLVVLANALLFQEFTNLTAAHIVGLICGFLVIVCGIFMLHAFKDLHCGLTGLDRLMCCWKRRQPPPQQHHQHHQQQHHHNTQSIIASEETALDNQSTSAHLQLQPDKEQVTFFTEKLN